MEIQDRVCHDLKTESGPVDEPLPAGLRVLPFVFVFALLASAGGSGFFFYKFKEADTAKADAIKAKEREERLVKKLKADYTSVQQQVSRAKAVAAWIEGAAAVQPLTLTIARSVSAEHTLEELSISRSQEEPSQYKLGLKFNAHDTRQLDRRLEELGNTNYRAYSAQQSRKDGQLVYSSTLLFQKPD